MTKLSGTTLVEAAREFATQAHAGQFPTPKQVEKYTKAILFLSAYHKNSV